MRRIKEILVFCLNRQMMRQTIIRAITLSYYYMGMRSCAFCVNSCLVISHIAHSKIKENDTYPYKIPLQKKKFRIDKLFDITTSKALKLALRNELSDIFIIEMFSSYIMLSYTKNYITLGSSPSGIGNHSQPLLSYLNSFAFRASTDLVNWISNLLTLGVPDEDYYRKGHAH